MFSRLNLCLAERETDHEPSRQEVTAFIISGGCTGVQYSTCPLYSHCTPSLSPGLVHWPRAETRTLLATARHDFSLQSGSNIAKIFSTIKSTQISSSQSEPAARLMNGSDMLTFHCERLHLRLWIPEYTDGDLLGDYNNYFLQSQKPNASNSQLLIDASVGKRLRNKYTNSWTNFGQNSPVQ